MTQKIKKHIFFILIFILSSCIGQKPDTTFTDITVCKNCNIIIISIDALRADHLGIYGYEKKTSIILDKLAESSIVFENAYAPSSWTRPSMASMLTSKLPHQHGVLGEGRENVIDSSFKTLAEKFLEHGYSTGGFVANSNLNKDFGFSQGFEVYKDNIDNWRTGKILKETYGWINQTKKPFFAWIHLNEPHDPYTPPGEYEEKFVEKRPGNIDPMLTSRENLMGINGGEHLFDEKIVGRNKDWMVGLYDAEIWYVFEEIRVLLYKLSQNGFEKNTIIIITSDHGEEFLDHGGLYHGHTLYQELVRIPLLLYSPNLEADRFQNPVSLIDIFPTLTQLTGISNEDVDFEGVNLLKSKRERKIYGETNFRDFQKAMVINQDQKIIHDFKNNKTEIYDLKNDSTEKKVLNLSSINYAKSLIELKQKFQKKYNPIDQSNIDNETIQKLRKIGYLI